MLISDPAFVADKLFLDPDADPLYNDDGSINFILQDTAALIYIVDAEREANGLRPMMPSPQHKTDYDDDGWYSFYIDVREADNGRTFDQIRAVVDSRWADDDQDEYFIDLSDDARKALYQKIDEQSVEKFGVDLTTMFAEAREYAERP